MWIFECPRLVIPFSCCRWTLFSASLSLVLLLYSLFVALYLYSYRLWSGTQDECGPSASSLCPTPRTFAIQPTSHLDVYNLCFPRMLRVSPISCLLPKTAIMQCHPLIMYALLLLFDYFLFFCCDFRPALGRWSVALFLFASLTFSQFCAIWSTLAETRAIWFFFLSTFPGKFATMMKTNSWP